jgi:hypothetical protein
MDNTLNLLSVLSYVGKDYVSTWDQWRRNISTLFKALFFSPHVKVFAMGGNNVAGIFGQMSAMLEFADQIEAGLLEDPDAIYLPVGSSCTITGLILGVCLSRKFRKKAFRSPRFKIVGVIIHHGLVKLQKLTGLYQKGASKYLPVSPWYGILATAAKLRSLGGPDVEKKALDFLKQGK